MINLFPFPDGAFNPLFQIEPSILVGESAANINDAGQQHLFFGKPAFS